jgi:hypothetical protein
MPANDDVARAVFDACASDSGAACRTSDVFSDLASC